MINFCEQQKQLCGTPLLTVWDCEPAQIDIKTKECLNDSLLREPNKNINQNEIIRVQFHDIYKTFFNL